MWCPSVGGLDLVQISEQTKYVGPGHLIGSKYECKPSEYHPKCNAGEGGCESTFDVRIVQPLAAEDLKISGVAKFTKSSAKDTAYLSIT